MPFPDWERTWDIGLITFPGADALEEVDLLDYPWLLHELGHDWIEGDSRPFVSAFHERFGLALQSIKMRSFGSGDVVRARTRDLVNQISEHWLPQGKTTGWFAEIASDAVALWTCGPAFLDAFVHTMRREALAPFEVRQGHPPYSVRGQLLKESAQKLSWQCELTHLDDLLEEWAYRKDAELKDPNLHAALTRPEFIAASVDSLLEALAAMAVPICDREVMRRLTQRLEHGHSLQPGLELIVGAHVQHRMSADVQAFEQWELSILQDITDGVTW